MLGRYAHDVTEQRKGQPIETQAQQEESASKSKEALWQIMVRSFADPEDEVLTPRGTALQVDMTPAGKAVVPSATAYEQRLLDAKYKIFRESIDIQRKWRAMIDGVEK